MANLVPKMPPRGVTLDDWTPKALGAPTLGVSPYAARADHVHPAVAGDGTPITRELIVDTLGGEPVFTPSPYPVAFELQGSELVLILSDGTELRRSLPATGGPTPTPLPGGAMLLNGGGRLLLNGGGALLFNGA